MNRLGLIPPSDLIPEQKKLYDDFSKYTGDNYGNAFTTKLDDGRFVGPFGIQLHTPEIGQSFLSFAKALRNIPGLPSHAREVAILVVGAHTKAAYEVAAHEQLSNMERSDLDLIAKRICPDHFDEPSKIAFKVADELFEPRPLSKSTWDEAVKVLGVSGTTRVVHTVGFYKYVATILNGFDAQVPTSPSMEV